MLFLHGGFCFDTSDWEETKAFRDAGFVVMLPNRRGENGQPGNFTMFYDEVDDVIGAAEYLRQQPFIDRTRLYVAGLSTGGTLTMLTALTYPHFRAAASFSGSPDAVGYTRHAIAIGAETDVPFDYRDARELNFYGTTSYGSATIKGTVFRLSPNGEEVVLHRFSGADGALPEAKLLLDPHGTLYGTTRFGGDLNCSVDDPGVGCGVVFAISK